MLRFDPLFSPLVVVLLAVGAMAGAVWAYRSARDGLGRRAWLTATSLRLLAIVLAASALLRPRLVHETVLHQKRRCAVLLDASRSMAVADEAGGRTRVAAARALLATHRRLYDRLALRYDLRTYAFAESADPIEPRALAAEGDRTDLATALATAARDFRGDQAAGILLISDGTHNAATDLAVATARLRDGRVPVFAIGLGSEVPSAQHEDVAMRTVDCAPRAFVGNRLRVMARLHYVGAQAARTAVVLREGTREVARQLVAFEPGPQTRDVRFEYVARQLGFHKLTVAASPLAGEANVANNELSTMVRVASARLVVFYLEGRIRPEFKFIRRSLGAAANLELLAANAFLAGPEGVARVLPEAKTWPRINVVILGDVGAAEVGTDTLARLKAFVRDGGGLLMIGGERSFGAGGYAGTPLADALPVRLAAGDTQHDAVFAPRLASAGVKHPVTRLVRDEAANTAAWAALPKLRGGNLVAGAKPNAATLLEDPSGRPVLVVQDYGRGRSAALTVDTTWRWALTPSGTGESHRRFWRQLVLWLARSDYSRQQAIAVSTDRTRYAVGAHPVVTAVVQPVDEATGKAEIVAIVKTPAGTLPPFRLGRGAGTHALAMPAPTAHDGEHSVTVEARDAQGKALAADSTVFLVRRTDPEGDERVANLARLRHLAHQTGGGFFTADTAGDALRRLLQRKPPAELARRHAQPLATSGVARTSLLALFLIALTGDWIIRKRKGLA